MNEMYMRQYFEKDLLAVVSMEIFVLMLIVQS